MTRRPTRWLLPTLLLPVLACAGWIEDPCTGGIDWRSPCTGPRSYRECRANVVSYQWTWKDRACPDPQVCATIGARHGVSSICVDALVPEGCLEPDRTCDDGTLRLCKTTVRGEGYWRTTACRHGCAVDPEHGPVCGPAPTP